MFQYLKIKGQIAIKGFVIGSLIGFKYGIPFSLFYAVKYRNIFRLPLTIINMGCITGGIMSICCIVRHNTKSEDQNKEVKDIAEGIN